MIEPDGSSLTTFGSLHRDLRVPARALGGRCLSMPAMSVFGPCRVPRLDRVLEARHVGSPCQDGSLLPSPLGGEGGSTHRVETDEGLPVILPPGGRCLAQRDRGGLRPGCHALSESSRQGMSDRPARTVLSFLLPLGEKVARRIASRRMRGLQILPRFRTGEVSGAARRRGFFGRCHRVLCHRVRPCELGAGCHALSESSPPEARRVPPHRPPPKPPPAQPPPLALHADPMAGRLKIGIRAHAQKVVNHAGPAQRIIQPTPE